MTLELDSQMCIDLLQNNEHLSILDVRPYNDYRNYRLPGAANIDILSSNAFETLSKLKREKPYLIYCEVGVRSKSAIQIMTDMGFQNLYILINGISSYMGPLDTAKKADE